LWIKTAAVCNLKNAKELLHHPDIDGALVGGPYLKADSFAAIAQAAVKEQQAVLEKGDNQIEYRLLFF
jgi:triosephosphate isomerase